MSMAPIFVFPQVLEQRWNHWFDVVGRLRPGVSTEAAAVELRALGSRIHAAHLPEGEPETDTWGAAARSLRDARNDAALRRSILVLFGGVGLVLLIACANVANLALVRAASRQREVAVRLAIGASRRDVLRALLAESVLLSAIGGLVGLGVATWGVDAVRALAPASLVTGSTQAAQFLNLGAVGVDGVALLFTFTISILTGVGFGMWPALRATRTDLALALKDGAPGAAFSLGGGRRPDARMLLVAGDVALSLMLLIGAGLLLRSFVRLRGLDAGFDPSGIITFSIQPPPDSVYDPQTAPTRKAGLLERLSAIPGVRSASSNMCAPLTARCSSSVVMAIAGREPFAPGAMPEIGIHSVDTAYFRTLGIPLRQGRLFTGADRTDAPKVAIINEAAARRLFGNESAIGQRVRVGISYLSEDETAEVIGVVGDVQYRSPGTPAAPDMYFPMLAYTSSRGIYFVRTDGSPSSLVPAIRNAVRQFDPDLPVFDVRTMVERAGFALSAARFGAVLLSTFATLALVLAAVGVYGVVAYSVAQRTREIGIRMALGAAEGTVVSLVLRQGLVLALAGVVAGAGGAMALTRVLDALLYEVSPTDPATFVGISLGLVVVTVTASLIPAIRAARVDPMRALRVE
jgi:predicted permease